MRITEVFSAMPRLNIYLPDDVYKLAGRWRDSANLSEICARAIKDELDAAEAHRSAASLFRVLRSKPRSEEQLVEAYGLAEAIVVESNPEPTAIRDAIGRGAAAYLDQNISEGSQIALAGGRQMWCVVRSLSPRHVRTTITALGMHHADPVLLHAHPNTLATLVWLLYSPRSEAHIVGTTSAQDVWAGELPSKPYPSYFVISSCSSFDEHSSFAQLLGADARSALIEKGALGDFGYIFIDRQGKEIQFPLSAPNLRLPAELLRELSSRPDARTLLVAGGEQKMEMIRATLEAKLCNTLITDQDTASRLLE
jgi:DNA-binding transcriptional regulator LsrR (DeoR family)